MFELLKSWFLENKKGIVSAIFVALVASLSFGLGYLVNRELNHAPIIIEKRSE